MKIAPNTPGYMSPQQRDKDRRKLAAMAAEDRPQYLNRREREAPLVGTPEASGMNPAYVRHS